MPVSISTPSSNLGRHVFGAAALAFSLITLAWHDYNGWHLPRYIVLPRRRCRDLRRSCDSVPADHENGRKPQGSPQNRPTVVTSKPANGKCLGLGCFTPPPPVEASLFSCANSVDRI